MNTEKYVVLEHLTLPNRGLRFWTSNTENNTHSFNGELWYKEIMFTDSDQEATAAARNGIPNATQQELEDYWKKEIEKRESAINEDRRGAGYSYGEFGDEKKELWVNVFPHKEL